jgi:hypothetical protein
MTANYSVLPIDIDRSKFHAVVRPAVGRTQRTVVALFTDRDKAKQFADHKNYEAPQPIDWGAEAANG